MIFWKIFLHSAALHYPITSVAEDHLLNPRTYNYNVKSELSTLLYYLIISRRVIEESKVIKFNGEEQYKFKLSGLTQKVKGGTYLQLFKQKQHFRCPRKSKRCYLKVEGDRKKTECAYKREAPKCFLVEQHDLQQQSDELRLGKYQPVTESGNYPYISQDSSPWDSQIKRW